MKRYKIIDLPTVGMSQAFAHGSHPGLRLYGEHMDAPTVELMPPWDYTENSSDEFNQLFNMDSMPEIETRAALDYLQNARTIVRKDRALFAYLQVGL